MNKDIDFSDYKPPSIFIKSDIRDLNYKAILC